MRINSDVGFMVKLARDKGYMVMDGAVVSPSGKTRKLGLKNNYPTFNMRFPRTRRVIPVPVHCLVGLNKFGDQVFSDVLELRHINGNRLDFSEGNIVLGTHSQNMMDIDPVIRLRNGRHAASRNVKYGPDVVANIGSMRARSGLGYRSIGKILGIPKASVRSIIKRHSL